MSESIVIAFLVLSLFAYIVSGGADFGVGILELTAPRRQRASLRKLGERAIAPIWEANHIWIILALVIVFVGFPLVHIKLTTNLHIPLLLMLAGIVVRGTAFTFRYYDLGDDQSAQRLWSVLFRVGSMVVPLVFGHIAAAMSRGQILPQPTTVYETYLAPWVGPFPLATGVFTVTLFAWLAAVFLVGELVGDERTAMVTRARVFTLLVVVTGGVVSGCAWYEGVPWLLTSASRPVVYLSVGVATAAVIGLWFTLASARIWLVRASAGLIVAAILGGYWGAVFPIAIEQSDGNALTWYAAAAPTATMDALATALLIAGALILPGLIYLYRLFKAGDPTAPLSERTPVTKRHQ